MTVEHRADRIMRRRWGFVAREAITWHFIALGVAVRDLQRAARAEAVRSALAIEAGTGRLGSALIRFQHFLQRR